ncbi:MAG: hypothetical protein U9Q17_03085 [Chloroflexota bacterium]|nr:hypothetical protein [Chloroflexota bacterium]
MELIMLIVFGIFVLVALCLWVGICGIAFKMAFEDFREFWSMPIVVTLASIFLTCGIIHFFKGG